MMLLQLLEWYVRLYSIVIADFVLTLLQQIFWTMQTIIIYLLGTNRRWLHDDSKD
jgi:hypothetical protein